MNRLIVLIFMIYGLFACSEKPKNSQSDPEADKMNVRLDSKVNSVNLQFNFPTILDSSEWVLYPLTLELTEETTMGIKSGGYGGQKTFWNVAFFNTDTKQNRLLSDSLKMIINSISPANTLSKYSGNQNQVVYNLIHYSIIKNDFNEDGNLNSDDPEYLFISDFSGKGFKQISPDNTDLIGWQNLESANKILIQARKDSNDDKKFDEDDEIVSFIYDLKSSELEHVFDDEFNLKTKNLFNSQWSVEE